MSFCNNHRHDQYSTFDGFGTPKNAAKYAKELGQTALGIANHGNVNGIIDHYFACKEVGIKPILGVEAYFQPKFDKEKKNSHLCLYAQNKIGYSNIMKIISKANECNFYRYPVVDFDLLEQHNEGVIATSACVAGYIPRLLEAKKFDVAEKALIKFKTIFKNRFFLEVMSIEITDDGLQKRSNEAIIKLGKKHKVPIILTCDSHFIEKDDYDSYLIMHAIGNKTPYGDYSKKYMPSEKEVLSQFKQMHGYSGQEFADNTQKIADMCEDDYLHFDEMITKLDWGKPSKEKLKELAVKSLKKQNKFSDVYKARLKKELETIFGLGFEDYFLLCYDIIKFAIDSNIAIGKGRGSVCGSLLAYSLGLTDVDPIILGTMFERFLRPDKKKMPDIDMDFGQDRRGEVIEYVMNKHKGKAAQIATFGYYKVKNLANDLAKVFKMEKQEIVLFKHILELKVGEKESVDFNYLIKDINLKTLNSKYKNIVKHFSKLYGQIRFIGKHAAGVAITVDDITNYTAVIRSSGGFQTAFDLNCLGKINVLKMDILGLTTASAIHEAEQMAGTEFSYDMLEDEELLEEFRNGNTNGIFQFEKESAKDILRKINVETIQDVISASALNRPAPIQLGVLDKFIDAKINGNIDKKAAWYKYTKDTYGTIIYQEHVMKICRGLAKMEWNDVDKIMKNLRTGNEEGIDPLEIKFIEGAKEHSGMSRKEAKKLYESMTLYLFNKGHGAGYGLLSFYQMHLKHYHPLEFWYAMLKFESDDIKRDIYKSCAVQGGVVLLLPHVNGKAEYSISKLQGDEVVQEGLSSIKNVGLKSAKEIERLGPFKDKADFLAKVPKRAANSRVVQALEDAGALEFDRKRFLNRTIRWNSSLNNRQIKVW